MIYKISGSSQRPKENKAATFDFKEFETTDEKEFLKYINTHSIVPVALKEGYRCYANVIKIYDVVRFDVDKEGEAEELETKLLGYHYIKKPSTNNHLKDYKWHYLVFIKNSKNDPQKYKHQVKQMCLDLSISLQDMRVTEVAVQNMNPYRDGKHLDEAMRLTKVFKGKPYKLVKKVPKNVKLTPIKKTSKLSKKGIEDKPQNAIKIKKTHNNLVELEQDSMVQTANGWLKLSDLPIKKDEMLSGLGCPVCNQEHSDGQGGVGYAFATMSKAEELWINCTGSACKDKKYKVTLDESETVELEENSIENITDKFNELVSKGANKEEVYKLIASLNDREERRILAKRMLKMNRSAYDGLLLSSMISSIDEIYKQRTDVKQMREKQEQELRKNHQIKIKTYPYPDYLTSTDKEGSLVFEVKSTRENMKKLLERNNIKSSYDVITRSINANYNGKDYDFAKEADTVRSDVVSFGQMDEDLHHSKKIDIDRRLIADHYDLAIQGEHINPLVDFIKKKHKKAKRKSYKGSIQSMVNAINSNTGSSEYQYTISKKWLVQCLAAWDGCMHKDRHKGGIAKYESVLVLSGSQGLGKTKFFNHLMSPFKHIGNYFLDGATFQKGDKDNLMQITSYAMVELGELDRLKTTGASDFKAFTSKQVDEFRMPYARTALTYPRHTSFCGSVNHAEFLNDITGARRFLIMEAGEIELDKFVPLNVWIEAWELYTHGESWWLDDSFDMKIIEERDKINDSATDNGVAQDLYIQLTELIPIISGNVAKGRISATKIISCLTGSHNVNGFERSQLISLIRKDEKYKVADNGLIEVGEEGVRRLINMQSSDY